MTATSIKIGRKTYKLKFGYGVNRRLSEAYKLTSYTGLGVYIEELKFGGDDLTFAQIDFIGNLIFASISYSEGVKPELDVDDIIDHLFAAPEKLVEILEAFMASIPKGDAAGKPQPVQKRKAQKKK